MQPIDQKQMLPVGTMLNNRYKIIRHLASGGFGNTYEAEDSHLDVKVAVKEFFMRGINHRSEDKITVVVSNDNNQELFDTQLQKFMREANRISSFHCDHIIHVFDLFDANSTSYYVMELLQGTSLDAQLHQQPLSEGEARDVVYQVLSALKVMHDNGLYHLDIKPGNIIRDKKGHCTLIDFGASKQLSTGEGNSFVSSAIAYTPGFAPIEQITQQTKHIGPWTDIFALGATFYSLLTGKNPPRVDEDDSELGSSMFPFPPTVSENTRQVISAMMKYSRKHRPQNVEEVKALLDGGMPASVNDYSEEATQIDKNASESDGLPKKKNDKKGKSRKTFYAVLGFLAIAVCGLLLWMRSNGGLLGIAQKLEQKTREQMIADSIEKARNDSIQKVINDSIEKARIDSINAAKYLAKDATTPDLTFFELHGPVKTAELYLGKTRLNLTFDEKGNLASVNGNKNYWVSEEKYFEVFFNDNSKILFGRDKKGRLSNFSDLGFEWKGGRVVGFCEAETDGIGSSFSYNKEGLLIKKTYCGCCGVDGGYIDFYKVHYPLIYEAKDHMNNWTQRRINVKGITKEMPDGCDEDIDVIRDYEYFFLKKETRKITYYY